MLSEVQMFGEQLTRDSTDVITTQMKVDKNETQVPETRSVSSIVSYECRDYGCWYQSTSKPTS